MKSLSSEQKSYLFRSIRTVRDFPKPGILFYDITTLVGDREAFNFLLDHLTERYADYGLDYIVGIESRGFIFAAALAARLRVAFVPIRKAKCVEACFLLNLRELNDLGEFSRRTNVYCVLEA